MRDEMDARMWVEHHAGFADGIDRAFARIRHGLGRFAAWDGTTAQLIALVTAFALTALNISFSSNVA